MKGVKLKNKVMCVFGTRPEAIKMAPIIKVCKEDENIELIVCVTAQHREMLDQVLETFNIKPDYDLDIMKDRQSINDVMASVITKMKDVLIKENPDIVLIHGDTATSFGVALAAFYEKIAVAHVEAGLRTNNKYSPFPEEMNRNLSSKIAELHFAPTQKNRQNLLLENIPDEKIIVTGNTVIDAMLSVVKRDFVFKDEIVQKAIEDNKRIILLTSHRRENQGKPMLDCFSAMRDLVEENKDTHLIYPVHLNPAVRELANQILSNHPRISLIEPLEYKEFANLMSKSYLIFTDSGGIQEEAPALDIPVVVIRTETERPEGVEAGTLVLGGIQKENIFEIGSKLLNDLTYYNSIAKSKNPYGDGTSSVKILQSIKKYCKIINKNV